MKAVVTRVDSARVTRAGTGEVLGEIGRGFLVLLGVHADDAEREAAKIADRICGLRIFDDENGKMNTLWADCRSRRPGFTAAARPETAIPLYERVIALCRGAGFRVETGEFGADMLVESVNNGPVTILLDTREL